MILSFLIAAAAAASSICSTKKNCLSCLEIKDCYFCLSAKDGPQCFDYNTTDVKECANAETVRTKRCVQELGGDAKDSVRYAIGFSILGAAIIIDLVIRFCSRRVVQDEYSHL